MQEFIRFLNQGWVGTFVGTAGATLAVFLYWRSRIPGIIAFQSQNVSMVGGGDAVFPAEVTFQYQGTPVPRITSSTVWMWNAGKKTVRGSDIVAHDPLRLRFSAEVLTVSIRKVSREAVQITADTSEDRKIVRCGFEFLDPGDGGVLEVLHTGSNNAPECTGTIIGLPKDPQYWGRAWGSSASSRQERRANRFMFTAMAFVGLAISVVALLGEQHIKEALPFLATLEEIEELPWPSWLSVLGRGLTVLAGLLLSFVSSCFVWYLGRRSPSSLDVD